MTTLDEAFWRVAILASLHCYKWLGSSRATRVMSHEHGVNAAENMTDEEWAQTIYGIEVVNEVIAMEKAKKTKLSDAFWSVATRAWTSFKGRQEDRTLEEDDAQAQLEHYCRLYSGLQFYGLE